MQSVKLFMRQVGSGVGVIPVSEVEDEVERKFTAQGYSLFETHYLGEVRGDNGETLGFKVLFVFVKDSEPVEATKSSKATLKGQ
jgi:hypothetical protein